MVTFGRSLRRMVLALTVSSVLMASLFMFHTNVTAAPAASRIIGGLDLQRYCSTKYYANNFFNYSSTGWVVLQQYNAFGWKCEVQTIYVDYGRYPPARYTNRYYYGIDMNDVCRS